MPDPTPVRPRVKDARAYERAMRRAYLNPLFNGLTQRLAQAEGVNQAYFALRQGITAFEAQPRAGIPLNQIVSALNSVEGYNRERMFKAFRAALGVDIRPLLTDPPVRAFMQERIRDNVDLIKTIPERTHAGLRKRIAEEFLDAPFDSQRMTQMIRAEYKSEGYNLRRIVRDQQNKLNGQLNHMRQQQVGVTHYVWMSVQDQRVRPDHVERNGRLYEWGELPPSEEPGQPVQCRCTARPVITKAHMERLQSLPKAA